MLNKTSPLGGGGNSSTSVKINFPRGGLDEELKLMFKFLNFSLSGGEGLKGVGEGEGLKELLPNDFPPVNFRHIIKVLEKCLKHVNTIFTHILKISPGTDVY